MAKLLRVLQPEITIYRDRRYEGSEEQWQERLRTSTTVYVGNLSFYTSEEQVYELFSKAGEVTRVVMGLDRIHKTPCGFCFVIYKTREGADNCVKYVNGTKLDDRPIRVDYDWGYEDGLGRQYGRGRSGGQVRDEFRVDYDPDRGGYGKKIAEAWREQVQQSFDSVAATQAEEPTPPPPPSKRQRGMPDEGENPRFRGQDEEEDD